MRERDLRDLILVKAIEECDAAGEVIPLADRAVATRETLREDPAARSAGAGAAAQGTVSRDAQRLLVARARRLLHPLRQRHPFLDTLLHLIDGPAWVGAVLLLASLAIGATLSAIGGSNHIDILGFPLLLLVLWNLVVYALLAVHALRTRTGKTRAGWLTRLYLRSVSAGAKRLLVASSRFNAPLTAALKRFAGEWLLVSRRRLVARGTRLFHGCSASLALGLIAGLYFRGIWRGYRAGWDSTWPDLVPGLVHGFYRLAATLTHIALPDAAQLEVMRWTSGPGAAAAPWIHLMAATALLFIIGPRLALALWASVGIWRSTLMAVVPANVLAYSRTVLGPLGLMPGRGSVSVTPYSYQPSADTLAALKTLLPAALGESVVADLHASVPFGEEEAWLSDPARATDIADCTLLLVSLAATPEDENQGRLITGRRDALAAARPDAQLLVLVDEGPYLARLSGAPERLADRRQVWRQFMADRRVPAAFVDLRATPAGEATGGANIEAVRAAVGKAAGP